MLMRDFAAKSYIALDDVRDKPIQGVIKDVGMGGFDRPVIELEDGQKFSLNKTNVAILIKGFGETRETGRVAMSNSSPVKQRIRVRYAIASWCVLLMIKV